MVALLSDAAFALAIGARACGVPPPVPLRRDHRNMLADLAAKQRAPVPMRQIEEAKRQAVPAQALPDLIAVLAKGKPLMPAQIKTLAEALQTVKDTLPRAVAAAQGLVDDCADLVSVVGQVDTFRTEIRKHTAGVQALLGGLTNGGPALDDAAVDAPKLGAA